MKNIRIAALGLLLAAALCACGGDTAAFEIDYGSSQLYTARQMDDAIGVIEREFNKMEGCTLHSLQYAGDRVSQDNVAYCNSFDRYADANECMVFHSSFQSPEKGGGAWEPDTEYTWDWYLAREPGGGWELVTYGY